jgi:hypothetical protein
MTTETSLSNTIEGKDLTTFEIAPDGSSFRLHFRDQRGDAASLSLPTASLQSLILTLPAILDHALKLQHRDNSLRLVYPLGKSTIEHAAGSDQYILTLATEDGFKVSFAVTEAVMQGLADTIAREEAMLQDGEQPFLN